MDTVTEYVIYRVTDSITDIFIKSQILSVKGSVIYSINKSNKEIILDRIRCSFDVLHLVGRGPKDMVPWDPSGWDSSLATSIPIMLWFCPSLLVKDFHFYLILKFTVSKI